MLVAPCSARQPAGGAGIPWISPTLRPEHGLAAAGPNQPLPTRPGVNPSSPSSPLHSLPRAQYGVMVTAGANQAFTNVVLTLLDETDRAVLFAPIYFNHRMAIQMTGGGDRVVLGPRVPGLMHADLDWLEAELAGPTPPKMVSRRGGSG